MHTHLYGSTVEGAQDLKVVPTGVEAGLRPLALKSLALTPPPARPDNRAGGMAVAGCPTIAQWTAHQRLGVCLCQ